jgi:hypothetical protein
MTTDQIIFALIPTVINLTILFFLIKSNTVTKERLKSQDDINQKMKSLMDIFSVEELKKFVDLRTESMQLQLDNHLEKESKKFRKDAESYIRNIISKDIDKSVENIENKYEELCEGTYNILLTLPIDERPKFISEHFPLTGKDFIDELKDCNEWPNI